MAAWELSSGWRQNDIGLLEILWKYSWASLRAADRSRVNFSRMKGSFTQLITSRPSTRNLFHALDRGSQFLIVQYLDQPVDCRYRVFRTRFQMIADYQSSFIERGDDDGLVFHSMTS